MAILERQGPSQMAPWIRLRGKLRGDDEAPLGRMASEPAGFDHVVLDVRGLRELTDEGCEALRRLAGSLLRGGRRLRIFYLKDSSVAGNLEATGLLEDRRIEWVGVRDDREDDRDVAREPGSRATG